MVMAVPSSPDIVRVSDDEWHGYSEEETPSRCILVRVLQRKNQHDVCLYMERKIYLKILAHGIMEALKSKVGRVGCQA